MLAIEQLQQLQGKSYQLHIFVLPKESTATWGPPAGGPDEWEGDRGYAGGNPTSVRASSLQPPS